MAMQKEAQQRVHRDPGITQGYLMQCRSDERSSIHGSVNSKNKVGLGTCLLVKDNQNEMPPGGKTTQMPSSHNTSSRKAGASIEDENRIKTQHNNNDQGLKAQLPIKSAMSHRIANTNTAYKTMCHIKSTDQTFQYKKDVMKGHDDHLLNSTTTVRAVQCRACYREVYHLGSTSTITSGCWPRFRDIQGIHVQPFTNRLCEQTRTDVWVEGLDMRTNRVSGSSAFQTKT